MNENQSEEEYNITKKSSLTQMNGNFISEVTYNEIVQDLENIKSKEKRTEETKEAVESNKVDTKFIIKKT